MSTARVLILVCLVSVAGTQADSAEYFLSPEGCDENPGTREAPWQTVARANAALEAGDTATFLPGKYRGPISPANSGREGAPITYRASPPRKARIVPGEGIDLIRFGGPDYIAIEGFELDGLQAGRWFFIHNSHHLTIRGCAMRNTRTASVNRSTQVRLLDNVFNANRTRGDLLHIRNSDHVLVEGNSFTRSGHSPMTIWYCNYVTVRANVFHCEWGRNYHFWNCARVLFDGNIITRARDSAGSAGSVAQISHDHSIVRHNRLFDNLGPPLTLSSYIWQGVTPTGDFREPFDNINNRFYHNVFTDNLGVGLQMGTLNVSSNVFQNNIFYRNDWPGGHVQLVRPDGISRDNRFVNNLLRGDEPGQALVRYADNFWTAEEANRRTPTTGGFWSEFHGNLDAAPGFLDPDNRDYRLAPGSAAMDAGEPLARAVGSGTGSTLPVNDGVPFYDGFGIDGEEGDWIAIGSGDNLARVQRVELRYYRPAILHLDREVTWTNAMPVSLPWAGEGPDIGAFQHGVQDPSRVIALADPAVAEPGQPVQFTMDTLGKELDSVLWDFGDGHITDEVEPVHVFEEGHYAVTLRATFTNGRRGVDAVFIKVEPPVDPSAPFVEADFEDATREEKWGFHFKFYRDHQTGSAHVDRPDGDGKCMHIFYDAGKANRTAAQIAPGAWDIDRYPFVRFQYRIPEGVPVAVQFNPFSAPGRPENLFLAGTVDQVNRFGDVEGYTLVDDGQWREITLDVRRLRQAYPDLQHLQQFMFSTPWTSVPGAPAQRQLAVEDFEFWFDDFAIVPETPPRIRCR